MEILPNVGSDAREAHRRRGEPRGPAPQLPPGPRARRPGRGGDGGREGRRLRPRRRRGRARVRRGGRRGARRLHGRRRASSSGAAGIDGADRRPGRRLPRRGGRPSPTHELAAAVWTLDCARALGAAGAPRAASSAVHVKVETGMTPARHRRRRGARVRRGAPRASTASTSRGVFSHFASRRRRRHGVGARADRRASGSAVEGLAAAGVRPPLVHLANSAAVLCEPRGALHHGAARAHALRLRRRRRISRRARALRPAMRLRTAAAQVRRVPPRTPVGYGGTFVTARPSTIAVLPLGYADGYHRLASNRGRGAGARPARAGRGPGVHGPHDDRRDRRGRASPPASRSSLFGAQGGAAIGADELAGVVRHHPLRGADVASGAACRGVYVEEFAWLRCGGRS